MNLATKTPAVPRYSIVVPVFNEGANIGAYCKQALQSLPGGYELLICYDFDGDDTLPALAALPADQKPTVIRLIKNELGRGVRYALEVGMRAARAPIVVVTMGDLSDDLSTIGQMVTLAESGADVVCGSRYMRGGRQIGGPVLKGLMSRLAGLTLHWFCGVPAHDLTNGFKAYRRSFLERTPILSATGFSLGLELVVRAHFDGGKIAEVPTTWHDRTAGQSHFRVLAWLPHYLYWYFWAFRQRWLGPSTPKPPIEAEGAIAILKFPPRRGKAA